MTPSERAQQVVEDLGNNLGEHDVLSRLTSQYFLQRVELALKAQREEAYEEITALVMSVARGYTQNLLSRESAACYLLLGNIGSLKSRPLSQFEVML